MVLYGPAIKDVCVAWRKALRKVWNVPPQTHNKTIALLTDSVHVDISLKACFCKFTKKTICLTQETEPELLTHTHHVFTSGKKRKEILHEKKLYLCEKKLDKICQIVLNRGYVNMNCELYYINNVFGYNEMMSLKELF